jgi:hypothetical protein
VYVASASEDLWADPKGEWLSAKYAETVYELFGLKGLGESMPGPDSPDRENHVGYHLRTGKHNIVAYDWQQYIEFAKTHFGEK